jgi:hypothetical protein
MALLDDVKQALRINNTAMDIEVIDLIESAKAELANTGIDITKTVTVTEDQTPEPTEQVLVEVETMDYLIKRAITLYCKANFGYENSEAERFAKSYEMLKIHLSLSSDYQVVVE